LVDCHAPGLYQGEILHFAADDSRRRGFSPQSWSTFATGGIRSVSLPGGHDDVLGPTQLKIITYTLGGI